MDIEDIRKAIAERRLDITKHALKELDNDGVWWQDVEASASSFDLIGTTCDERGVKCTIEGTVFSDITVRLVVAWSEQEGLLKIITAYVRRDKRRGAR